MDWQRFIQFSSVAIARSEKQQFTGVLELRVQYRNGVARRGHIRRTSCRVLNREPIDGEIQPPEREFRKLEPELIVDGSNADSDISIQLTFFDGLAVDRRTEVINIMS